MRITIIFVLLFYHFTVRKMTKQKKMFFKKKSFVALCSYFIHISPLTDMLLFCQNTD